MGKTEQIKFLNFDLLKPFSCLLQIFLQAKPMICHTHFCFVQEYYPKLSSRSLSPSIVSHAFICFYSVD